MSTQVFKVFAEALAIGLLVGVERYKARQPGEEKEAGVRTFALFALLGAVCAVLDQPGFTLVTFAGLIILLCIGYYRHSTKSIGITTEAAGLLTFWLGFLVYKYESLAVSTSVALVILLASKRKIHDFVKKTVSETEFYDTVKFLAVVFLVLPLLPDRDIGPYNFFNPTHVWLLVILFSTISFSGYVLMRCLGKNRGLLISGIAGGIVSTTAATLSLAGRAREEPQQSRACGVAAILANAAQFPRLLLFVWIGDRHLGKFLSLPLIGMAVIGLVGALLISRGTKYTGMDDLPVENPYSLIPALKFAAFFVCILLFSKVVTVYWGARGIYLGSVVAGAGDVSAIAFSIAKLVGAGSLSIMAAVVAILIGVTANAIVKWILAYVNGTRTFALWLGSGFLAMLGGGFALLILLFFITNASSRTRGPIGLSQPSGFECALVGDGMQAESIHAKRH
jgi:uncharacterized membrane protein (DUF4010 family)